MSSKRRNQVRRERRELERQGTVVESLTGADLRPDVIDHVYDYYLSTVTKYFWGRQYLRREFFEEVCTTMGKRILVVLARDTPSRRPIGGAFNLLGRFALYGRYWGACEERAFLHFNVCYYQGIEECIQRRLRVFEPGAGGEHKVPRGFEPTITHSVHHLADRRLDRAIRDFVARERAAIEEVIEDYARAPALKPV
jgi:predicted N-acyltransferase